VLVGAPASGDAAPPLRGLRGASWTRRLAAVTVRVLLARESVANPFREGDAGGHTVEIRNGVDCNLLDEHLRCHKQVNWADEATVIGPVEGLHPG
jgi:hypothetical protein